MADITGIRGTLGRLSNSTMGQYVGRSLKETIGFVYEGKKSQGFLGMKGGSFLGKAFGALNVAVTAGAVIQGAQRGGFVGAAEAGFEQAAWGLGANMIMGGVFNPAAWVAAAGLGAAYGGFKFGQAATRHRKDLRKSEFISPNSMNVIDGAYTDRARSLAALNNSSMNGRMAIGNEAQYLHTSYSGMSTFRR